MRNIDKLNQYISNEHKPFIVYDVETTGIMNGNDNKITQIALAKYDFNNQNKKYELQDKIFLLAKPDKETLLKIIDMEAPTKDNAKRLLKDQFFFDYGSKWINGVGRYSKAIVEHKEKLEGLKEGIYTKADFHGHGIEYYEKKIKENEEKLEEYTKEAEKIKIEKENKDAFFNNHSVELSDYINANINMKLDELKNEDKLADFLEKQGIITDKSKSIFDCEWLKQDVGLTNSEIQIGINEFLKKYNTNDTILMTNGTYMANHYLEKENMHLPTNDTTIDLIQVKKSTGFVGRDWSVNPSEFAEIYKNETGKEIKSFDALTKALMWGEIASRVANVSLTNNSVNYLTESVKESAFKNDDNYVMSLACMNSKNWHLGTIPKNFNGFIFSSLKYVEFGNDRRYVDLDKMFEINDNFEITLEGTKEPIKTWEELEAKIKALNSDISEELLNDIKEKYEEISKEALDRKHEQWEIQFNDGTLTKDNMSVEQHDYLEGKYVVDDPLEGVNEDIYGMDTGNDDLDGQMSIEDYPEYLPVDYPCSVDYVSQSLEEKFKAFNKSLEDADILEKQLIKEYDEIQIDKEEFLNRLDKVKDYARAIEQKNTEMLDYESEYILLYSMSRGENVKDLQIIYVPAKDEIVFSNEYAPNYHNFGTPRDNWDKFISKINYSNECIASNDKIIDKCIENLTKRMDAIIELKTKIVDNQSKQVEAKKQTKFNIEK